MAVRVSAIADDFEREGFGDNPIFEAIVAGRQSETVDLCLFFDSFSSWDGGHGPYAQDLFMADSAGGLGLGQPFLVEAAAIAGRRGGAYLRLSVDTDNALAQRFHERIGLRRSPTERIYQVHDEEFVEFAGSAKGAKA